MSSTVPAEAPDLERWYRDNVLIHEPALRAYVRRAFPMVADPDNLVQEALVRVVQARRETHVENVRPYLYATVRNLALNVMRRHDIVAIDNVAEIEELDIAHEARGVAEQVALNCELELLMEAVNSLPERCREVITLRKIEGLSHREIAQRFGISEHTVEAHLASGMRRCAEFFRRRGLLPQRKEIR